LVVAIIISKPTVSPAAGEPPKIIEEFVGRVNSKTTMASIARMTSPPGWREQGQTPEFDEFTVVLKGELQVETRGAIHKIGARDKEFGATVEGYFLMTRYPALSSRLYS
jgi:hypothetical protein